MPSLFLSFATCYCAVIGLSFICNLNKQRKKMLDLDGKGNSTSVLNRLAC